LTFIRYLLGVGFLAGVTGSVAFFAVRARRRLVPEWRGPTARLGEIVLGLSTVVLIAEVLGTVGLFGPVPIFTGCVLVAIGGWHWLPRREASGDPPIAADPMGAFGHSRLTVTSIAVGLTSVVVANWVAWTISGLQDGVFEFDSLQYHLTFAARFVQTGSVTALTYVGPDPVQAYHPATTELLYGLTMMALRSEVLVPLLGLAFLGLALLAGWCAGERRGVAPLTLLAVAAALSLPGIAVPQGGNAHTDVSSAALFAAAVALLLAASSRRAVFVAGLAGGLAVSMKLTALAPVLALTVLVLVLHRREQRRSMGQLLRECVPWLLGLAITGSYWMLRNLARTGSPIPTMHLGIGPFRLPAPSMPFVDAAGFSIAHYATDLTALRTIVWPGIRDALGPGAVVVVLLLGLGIVASIAGRDWRVRALGAVALISTLSYVFTPATAFGLEGSPLELFVTVNVRYVLPALLVGWIALALRTATARPLFSHSAVVAFGAVVVASQLETGALRTWPFDGSESLRAVAAVAIPIASVFAALWLTRRSRWRTLTAAGLVATIVLVLTGWAVDRAYERNRLTDKGKVHVLTAAAWSKTVHGAKIGDVGLLEVFSLTGTELTNEVRYLVATQPHGGAGPLTTCAALRNGINEGRYDFVAVGPIDPLHPVGLADSPRPLVAYEWVGADPNAKLVVDENGVTVYRITGALDPAACP